MLIRADYLKVVLGRFNSIIPNKYSYNETNRYQRTNCGFNADEKFNSNRYGCGCRSLGVFGVIERLNKLETVTQLAEKDLTQAEERLGGDIEKNNEFRIKWPRGELGSPPADAEQFMLIEHIAGQLEKIQDRMEEMLNNGVNIKRLQEDVKDLRVDVEKLKDGQRTLKHQNGN